MQERMIRIRALLLALLLLTGFLLSAAFIAAESDHDCHSTECATCRLLAEADRALSADKLTTPAAAVPLLLLAACAAAVLLIKQQNAGFMTPVSSRVRLDR